MSEVANQRQARAWALHHVRWLLRHGYNSERAGREISMGRTHRGEPGYNISHGKISVPCCRPNWTFRFADLEREILHPPAKPLPGFQIPLPLLFQ